MRTSILTTLLVIFGLSAVTAAISVAQVPSPQEIQRLLANPQSAEAIRQRLQQSGLTPDQVRARLQAAGLPTSTLDQFIRAQEGTPLAPSDTVISVSGSGRKS